MNESVTRRYYIYMLMAAMSLRQPSLNAEHGKPEEFIVLLSHSTSDSKKIRVSTHPHMHLHTHIHTQNK